MKTKKLFPIFFISLFLFFSLLSCSPQYIRKGKKEIKMERMRVNDLIPILYSLDNEKVGSVLNDYYAEIDTINKYVSPYITDQTSTEWKYLTEYGLIKKGLKMYSEVPRLKKDAVYSLTQLNNLKYDLQNKLISREQYDLYMKDEKKANDELIFKGKTIIQTTRLRLDTYYQLKPKMDSLVNLYKK